MITATRVPALLLLLALPLQAQTTLGPYFQLGSQDDNNLLDAGSLLRGALIFGADAGVPYVYNGTYWSSLQTATTAAMTLYVDPTGNDSNPCTATGTAACLTVNGAVNKVPKNIRHNVTVNIAAGTYTSTVTTIEGFQFYVTPGTTAIPATIPQLIITGDTNWTPWVPATGGSTGTVTTYTNVVASPMAFAAVTVAGGTWTVDDLKGSYLVWTAGAALTSRKQVIVGNTASVIHLNANVSPAAIAGDTFSIQRPSTILGSTTVTGLGGAGSLSGSLILTDMTITETAGGIPLSVTANTFQGHTAILLRHLRVVAPTAFTSLSIARSQVSLSTQGMYVSGRTSIGNGVNGAGYLHNAAGYLQGEVRLQAGTLLEPTSSFSAIAVYEHATTPFNLVGFGPLYGLPVLTGLGPIGQQRSWIRCTEGIGTALAVVTPVGQLFTGTVNITGCTTGISLSNGARLSGRFAPWVFSGVTNELVLDGENFTLAQLNALSPKVIQSPLGSAFVNY